MDDTLDDFRARLDGIDPTLRERYHGCEARSGAVVGVSRHLPCPERLGRAVVRQHLTF